MLFIYCLYFIHLYWYVIEWTESYLHSIDALKQVILRQRFSSVDEFSMSFFDGRKKNHTCMIIGWSSDHWWSAHKTNKVLIRTYQTERNYIVHYSLLCMCEILFIRIYFIFKLHNTSQSLPNHINNAIWLIETPCHRIFSTLMTSNIIVYLLKFISSAYMIYISNSIVMHYWQNNDKCVLFIIYLSSLFI